MWYMGIDPFTKQPAPIARGLRGRKLQHTLMQFSKRRTISSCVTP